MKRYLYTNQKGGVTKTTETIMNGNAGNRSGKRHLLVDIDPQGNTTYASGYFQEELQHTTYTLMMGRSTLEETLLPTYYDPVSGIFFDPNDQAMMELLGLRSLEDACRGPDLLPNNTRLCEESESELNAHPTWGTLLRDILDELEGQYDAAHIDTNPSIISKLTKNGYYAATDVVIPVVPENWAIQGMLVLGQHLMQARTFNRRLSIAGIVFSRVRYAAHRELIQLTRTTLANDMNGMFETERRKGDRQRQILQGLSVSCFEHMISEGAEFGKQTNKRANLLLANRGISPFALEYWQHYIELLQKTQGPGLQEAAEHYNRLVDQYSEAQQAVESRKRARAGTARKGAR
jgi:cellulose biosynthesis protein BcsQ